MLRRYAPGSAPAAYGRYVLIGQHETLVILERRETTPTLLRGLRKKEPEAVFLDNLESAWGPRIHPSRAHRRRVALERPFPGPLCDSVRLHGLVGVLAPDRSLPERQSARGTSPGSWGARTGEPPPRLLGRALDRS